MSRDRGAMHRLFALTAKPQFTGEAMKDHADVLAAVLCDVGDRFFSSCLNAEPAELVRLVRQQLLVGFGQDESQDAQKVLDQMKDTFPKTFPESYTPPGSQPATPAKPSESSPGGTSGQDPYDDPPDGDDNPGEDDCPVA